MTLFEDFELVNLLNEWVDNAGCGCCGDDHRVRDARWDIAEMLGLGLDPDGRFVALD